MPPSTTSSEEKKRFDANVAAKRSKAHRGGHQPTKTAADAIADPVLEQVRSRHERSSVAYSATS